MKQKRYTPFLFFWTYTFPSQFVYICLIIFNGCVTLHCVGDYNWYHKCWVEGKYIKMCVYISRAWNKAQITSNTSCFWEGNWVADFGLSLFGARVWFQVRELRSNKLSSGPHPNTINKTKRMGRSMKHKKLKSGSLYINILDIKYLENFQAVQWPQE